MLEDSPAAYITTLEEALGYSDSVWMERAKRGSQGSGQASMLGFDAETPVAMGIGLRRRQHRRDVLVVVSVYVSAAHRGSGLAANLMQAIEEWGFGWGAPLATLWVAEANPRARAFYERIGYQPTGDRARMKPGSDHWEIRMEKPLSNDTHR
jgi:GNAT superfamily N-acetyltransferase